MAVERINKIGIDSRSLFTGIVGPFEEYYVESDLRECSLQQELYLYLKSLGYLTVFYSRTDNFFSFSEWDLARLFGLIKRESDGEDVTPRPDSARPRFVASMNSPFARSRKKGIRLDSNSDHDGSNQEPPIATRLGSHGSNEGIVSHYQQIAVKQHSDSGPYYFIRKSENVFNLIFTFADSNPEQKFAVVFPTAMQEEYENKNDILAKLSTRSTNYFRVRSKLKIIALYDAESEKDLMTSFERENGFFMDNLFRNWMMVDPEDVDDENTLKCRYHIGDPGLDEIKHLLNRRRLLSGLNNVYYPIPFDTVSLRLWQKCEVEKGGKPVLLHRICDIDKLSDEQLQSVVSEFDSKSSKDKLKGLLGIEKIINQFESYLKDLKRARKRKDGIRFRPHMVFLGNPGTGKTTVARLFADILREEGVLSKGHLISATVADLEGQYVGETRIKTSELCEQARGGVLFVDEAYGLYVKTDSSTTDYGKEAIEVLLQFMENSDDSLVILAGYEEPMMELLRKGNQGFMRRFNSDRSFFYFEDYKPDVLYQIALKNLSHYETTEGFRSDLMKALTDKYKHRTKQWGNAGEVENIVSSIVSRYDDILGEGPITPECIPENLRKRIEESNSNNSGNSSESILQELNSMIGLPNVKQTLLGIINTVNANRKVMGILGESEMEMLDLNFVFSGNPGTGKTTVARLMGKIFEGAGILASSEVKEYSMADIVSQYSGQTAKRIKEMYDECIGKTLFIDEAYTLIEHKDAIDTIVQCATDKDFKGKLAVILAGYPDDMKMLLDRNSGMRRRFNYQVLFDDYTDDELWSIFQLKVKALNRRIEGEQCKRLAMNWFSGLQRGKDFPNAGACDQLLSLVKANWARRVALEGNPSPDFVRTFIYSDFPQQVES